MLNGNHLSGEEDVLINITYDMISPDAPSLDQSETIPLNILSVNFNTLFIIGMYYY